MAISDVIDLMRPRPGRRPDLYPVDAGSNGLAAKLCTCAEATREPALSEPWREALRLFDRDLDGPLRRVDSPRLFQRRGPARRVGQRLRDGAPGTPPSRPAPLRLAAVPTRDLEGRRRPQAGRDPRLLDAALLRAGEVSANPADLVATPKRDRKLPRVLSREELQGRYSSGSRPGRRSDARQGDAELAYSCGLRRGGGGQPERRRLGFEGERLRIKSSRPRSCRR